MVTAFAIIRSRPYLCWVSPILPISAFAVNNCICYSLMQLPAWPHRCVCAPHGGLEPRSWSLPACCCLSLLQAFVRWCSEIKCQLDWSFLLWIISTASTSVEVDLLPIRVNLRSAVESAEEMPVCRCLVLPVEVVIVEVFAPPASHLHG